MIHSIPLDRLIARVLILVLAPVVAVLSTSAQPTSDARAPTVDYRETATGHVFHDADGDGRRDPGERGLEGIKVSNGREIVQTDQRGRFQLAVDDDTIIFVIKPRNWRSPLNEVNLPRFYYIHKPHGSPPLYYPGVAPTGPLPSSIDFPLYPQDEPDRFQALLFGDPQPYTIEEVEYVTHDVVEELIGSDAAFGVTLGDIVGDDLSLFDPLNASIALIGIPWHNVIGNHDLNFDAPDDRHSDETFERVYGPPYYSFDYGPVHFIVLDDVVWETRPEADPNDYGTNLGKYQKGLGDAQLDFIRNDLALIPEDQLVTLMMHITFTSGWIEEERAALFRMIDRRPFCLSISAHAHYQQHRFLTREDGWMGAKPHHHVINVTVSGSWWKGAPDELGIPHTTMRDGAPNGYSIITFDGHDYSIDFRAARRPSSHQMNIWAPEEVAAADAPTTEVVANVFGGSERSIVEMRVGEEGDWIKMRKIDRPDPYYLELKKAEEGPTPPRGKRLPKAIDSPHLWAAPLPAGLSVGSHLIHIRTTDMFGETYEDKRIIRIR